MDPETRIRQLETQLKRTEQACRKAEADLTALQAKVAENKAQWAALRKRCEEEVDPYRDGPRLLERDERIVRGFIREIDRLSTPGDVVPRIITEGGYTEGPHYWLTVPEVAGERSTKAGVTEVAKLFLDTLGRRMPGVKEGDTVCLVRVRKYADE